MPSRTPKDAALSHVCLPALFALLTAVLVCVLRDVLNDGDTYTHIAAGAWMIGHRAVLARDPFSWTFAGHPWDAHEWLSEVFLAAADRLAGLTGVVLLAAAAAAIAIANLARHIARWSGWTETLLLTAAALACVLPGILARPHILALPLLESWVAGLLLARHERRAPSWWLLPLMTVWANMHGGFAFGLAIALPLAVEATLERRRRPDRSVRSWWVFLAGAAVAACLTPQGLNGLLFPLRLLRLHNLAAISEWQPMDFSTDIAFEIVLLALVALLGSGRVRVPPIRLLLLVGLLYMSIAHRRHGLLFGVAGPLILAGPVGRAFAASVPIGSRPRGRAACWSALALAVALRLAHPIAGTDSLDAPVSAIAQLPPDIARTPVLNSYQFGGYLAFVGLRPFIDGRAELFGDAFLHDFLELPGLNDDRLRQAVDRYGIGWAVLAVQDPLIARFDAMPGWRRQHADHTAIVFVRTRLVGGPHPTLSCATIRCRGAQG